MGAMGCQRQPECKRGHKLEEPNTLPATNGGRRCRACNRASATATNLKNRQGTVLTSVQYDALADAKYAELRP